MIRDANLSRLQYRTRPGIIPTLLRMALNGSFLEMTVKPASCWGPSRADVLIFFRSRIRDSVVFPCSYVLGQATARSNSSPGGNVRIKRTKFFYQKPSVFMLANVGRGRPALRLVKKWERGDMAPRGPLLYDKQNAEQQPRAWSRSHGDGVSGEGNHGLASSAS